jgi:5-oxoprolinase (ATP-hydrolysing) subunit A
MDRMDFTLNCDMGEGFGRYSVADDASLMPLIDLANIACGFHASDPVIMKRTVRLAGKAGVKIGAHPSLPDLQGFGRRDMAVQPADLTAMLEYQIGALWGIARAEGLTIHHVKPHGALYGMACRSADIAHAIADAALTFGLPILGLANTQQERVYLKRGLTFIPEFYADLAYDDDGLLLIRPVPPHRDAIAATERVMIALKTGSVLADSGKSVHVRAATVCVHSDSVNAQELLLALRKAQMSGASQHFAA